MGRWVHIPNLYPLATLMTCIGVVTELAACEAPQRRSAGAEKAPITRPFPALVTAAAYAVPLEVQLQPASFEEPFLSSLVAGL